MKKSFVVALTSILGLIVLTGCASQQIHPTTLKLIGTDHVFTKNYEINQKLTAYVGQPIVKVKDYKVNRFTSNRMRASDDFIITGGIVKIAGSKNTDYEVRGETTLDGEAFTVLNIPDSSGEGRFGALIRSDGSVYSKMLNYNIMLLYSFSTTPADLRFSYSAEEKIALDSGYLNYELIYGGTDGKSLSIIYREFTSNDFARPAFYQNVVYEAGKEQIRFRDIVMKIHEATNEQITLTVISDGLPK